MGSKLALLTIAAVVVIAGCVTPAALDPSAAALAAAPRVISGDASAMGLAPLVWEGRSLRGEAFALGPGDYNVPPCSPSTCDRIPFRVELPEDYWTTNPGSIEVSIEWEHQADDYSSVTTDTIPMGHYLGLPNSFMHLRVLDAQGNLVQEGEDAFHYASIALIDSLPPGDYIAEIQAYIGESTYVGVIQVEPKVAPQPGDQLPDLAILPPSELTLEHPVGREAPDPVAPLGRKGCDPDEVAEAGAVRCLRFATAFANIGTGPLELHLSSDEANKATLGEGRWVQYVFAAEGGHREAPAAPASYHKVHGHYHILGLDVSTVYAFDLASQTRGEALGTGHKTGFCPADSALVYPFGLGTTMPSSYGGCCYLWGFCQIDFVNFREYSIGLTPGWYDVYPWWRADQYVDIAGAPDGVYELETCANPDGFILEVRSDNNCASTIFRLTGDSVEVLLPDGALAAR